MARAKQDRATRARDHSRGQASAFFDNKIRVLLRDIAELRPRRAYRVLVPCAGRAVLCAIPCQCSFQDSPCTVIFNQ